MELVNSVAEIIFIEILSNAPAGFLIEIAFAYFSVSSCFEALEFPNYGHILKDIVWWTKQSVKNQEKKKSHKRCAESKKNKIN